MGSRLTNLAGLQQLSKPAPVHSGRSASSTLQCKATEAKKARKQSQMDQGMSRGEEVRRRKANWEGGRNRKRETTGAASKSYRSPRTNFVFRRVKKKFEWSFFPVTVPRFKEGRLSDKFLAAAKVEYVLYLNKHSGIGGE